MPAALSATAKGGKITFIENDWVNLQRPEWSRILRAPLAKGRGRVRAGELPRSQDRSAAGSGFICFGRVTRTRSSRPRRFRRTRCCRPIQAASRSSACIDGRRAFRKMLAIIRGARDAALADPRVDMPGAEVMAGMCRTFRSPPVPAFAPKPIAEPDRDGVVQVSWEVSAATIGLEAELHRASRAHFAPSDETRLVRTALGHFEDRDAPQGEQHYALVLCSPLKNAACPPIRQFVVPAPQPAPRPGRATGCFCDGSVASSVGRPRGSRSGYPLNGRRREPMVFSESRSPVRLPFFSDGRVAADKATAMPCGREPAGHRERTEPGRRGGRGGGSRPCVRSAAD